MIINGKEKKININNSLKKSTLEYKGKNVIKRKPIRYKLALEIFNLNFLNKIGKLKINKIKTNENLMKEKLSLVILNTKNDKVKLEIKAKYVIFLYISVIEVFDI